LQVGEVAFDSFVAMLAVNLGVRLFQRSTRRLMLTEAGERFLHKWTTESVHINVHDPTPILIAVWHSFTDAHGLKASILT
jgi:hypothetical protein